LDDHLPPVFDPKFYADKNPDLAAFDERMLREHYEMHGRSEGRSASPGCHRCGLLTLMPREVPILEIGPFDAPCAKGPDVRYFDVMDTEGLRLRAEKLGRNADSVPTIHFVNPNGDLSGVRDRFGAVVSSHCIEHQPDLIMHLNQVETLLEDGGRYFLIVPDKRYCFDHYLPESSVAGVLEAHIENRKVHSLRSVIEHRAMTTHNDPARHWSADHADSDYRATIGPRARAAVGEFERANGGYIDVHAWQFTPESFCWLLTLINELSMTSFLPERVYDTPRGSNEFAAVLRKA
jgi:hypothetical protein